jgi:hypothetical protein
MTRSMVGSSAAQCVDAAPVGTFDRHAWERRNGKKRRAQRLPEPRHGEGIPLKQCPRCGYPGPHADTKACISALRDRLAKFE